MRTRTFRTSSVIAAAAITLLVTSGCAATDDADTGSTDGDTGSSDTAVLGTVETMFGEITVDEPTDDDLTVVALGWSDAEMALALGVVPVGVFDWQGFGADTKGVGPWATDLFGDVTPEIIERGDEDLNFEQIELLEPDVILNTRSSNDEEEFERLNEIAPTVYAPEGTGSFATDWETQMTSVAAALGLVDEGATIIADTKDAIAAAADENPEFAGLTTASAAKFGDAYGSYTAGDGRFDILADLGFVSAPTIEELKTDDSFYVAISAEQVAAFDADVLVVVPIGYTLAETEADPLLASLSVVTEGRTVFIDPDSDLSGAFSAASVLSIPVVLDELVPELATAAAKVAE
jgi:iron complex transport system substrate-binding protein